MQQLFEAISRNGEIVKLSDGRWNGIKYRHGKFFLIATDGEGTVVEDTTPMAFTFSISAMEHDKSIAYPGIKRIIFDEFISRVSYIPDEFPMFMNILSTLIRERDDVDIWMLGNTVSKDCPYFREMGLKHIFQQQPGIRISDTYGIHGLRQQRRSEQHHERRIPILQKRIESLGNTARRPGLYLQVRQDSRLDGNSPRSLYQDRRRHRPDEYIQQRHSYAKIIMIRR